MVNFHTNLRNLVLIDKKNVEFFICLMTTCNAPPVGTLFKASAVGWGIYVEADAMRCGRNADAMRMRTL